MTKLIEFLRRVNRLPKNFISRGTVSAPTMTRVVTNAAMARTSAPCLRKDAARGKAIKAGMRTMEPNTAAMTTPMIPAFRPIAPRTNSEGRNVRMKPIVQMMATMDGARERNARRKNWRALRVFPRFLAQDRTSPNPATPQITTMNMRSHLTCVVRMAIFVRASMERVRFSFVTNTQLVGRTDTLCPSTMISPSP
jgi:hypothetical protein